MSLDRMLARTANAKRAGGTARARGTRAARLAWSISGLAAALGGLFLVMLALNSQHPDVTTYEYWGAHAVIAIIFPAVGALIVSKYPRHALGWLLSMIGLTHGVGGFASEYATYALMAEPGHFAGAVMAAWLGTWVTDIGFLSIPLVLHLYPNGRPLSPRWWPLLWVAAIVIVTAVVLIALMPGPLERYPLVENPYGIEGIDGALEIFFAVGGPILGLMLIAGVISLIIRYHRSQGIERQQLKWFTYAAAMLPLSLIGNTLFPGMAWLIGGVSLAFMPVAIGIAILRYRLYEIDFIINRTLVYGALTACIIGIYVFIVAYMGTLFRADNDLLVSLIATGIIAVVFAPLRDRLQRGVNRVMYGERDNPYTVLSRLGERLKATDIPEAALPTIVETVARALKLPYAAIALKQDDGAFEIAADHGSRPITGESLVLPLSYGTETIGQLVLSPRAPGEPFGPSDRRLLNDLARHAEAAAYAVRLTADLQHSRERLVNAREEERRRLRRDLHDGLGPQLATLILKLDAARNLLRQEPQAAEALLSGLKVQTQDAISEIRRLVYGLRPPALDELGLVPAIHEQATNYSQNGLNVFVEAPENLPDLPAAVEVAAYRIAHEALTNVVRHARASECRVRLSIDKELELEISDNGIGLPAARRAGVGLSSMRERAAELGGTCVVMPVPIGGTRVLARLPLPAFFGEKR